MAIARTSPIYEEEIGGVRRPLLLRNGEIERFEEQYAPFGVLGLFDQLCGRGTAPQVRHVRDLVALGLVGGGMGDRMADDLVASLPPSETMALRDVAQRLLGVTFFPIILSAEAGKKKRDGSRRSGGRAPSAGTPEAGS